jgi:hypothetical protein
LKKTKGTQENGDDRCLDGVKEDKGQLREWMTVARDRSVHSLHESPQAVNEDERQMTIDEIGLDLD